MKGKFRILGRIGLALFMVCALMVAFMPVAPVSAATEVTDVWVEFDADSANATGDTDHSNVYYVHFKPTTALSRGVDTVTVYWPDGSEAMGGDGTTDYAFTVDDDTGTTDATLCLSDTELKFSTDWGTTVDNAAADPSWYQCTIDATSAGYRTKITTPIDIAAGQDVWMWIDSGYTNDTLGIETPADTKEGISFKVKVATSQDTTPVLSSKFALGDAGEICTVLTTSVITSVAGAAAQYTFTINPTANVTQNTDKVTIKFPVGTTVPSSISAIDIQFSTNSGTDYSSCAEEPVVDSDRRMITAVTPVTLDGGDALNRMKVLSSAGVTNPTIAATDSDNVYIPMIRTTGDDLWFCGADYAITAGSANKVAIADGEIGLSGTEYPYSDDVTMVNMLSGYIYVYIADQYGNTVDCSSTNVTVTPSSSSETGTFYGSDNDAAGSGTYSTITTITVDASGDPTDKGQQVFYCDSTAGTHTLTFSATDYTDAEWTVSCAPVISLYDANDTLVNTYGATSTLLCSELGGTVGSSTTQKYGGDYLTDAINAAMAGDTIRLGDGTYEQDAVITLNKKVTLTSVNGASHTTLRPTTEGLTGAVDGVDASINVTADGTSTNPIIIDGLTFTWLRSATEFDSAVRNDGYDYVTVRNCVFNYIDPDHGQQHEAVIYYRSQDSGDITSATVSNNTFNNCCPTWPNPSGGVTANIFFTTSSTTNQISGVTISGNTMTNCNGYGVTVQGCSSYLITGSIKDNTLTNPDRGIYISDWTHRTTGASVTGNTITGAYKTAICVEGSNNGPITIKNNTITGCVVDSNGAVRIDNIQYDGTPGDTCTFYQVYVQYNDIYDNSSPCGLYVADETYVTSSYYQYIDCRYNWFGDASGPAYTAVTGAVEAKSNPNGTGDAVSDRVWYYPWLHKPVTDVVADNVSWQTSTMKLVAGWNTLSTPVPLIAAADTVDELIPSGMSIGYYYDGGWTQITTDYTLSPCDAVYVKMDEAKYVQLKFECKTFSTPSKDLAVGWNLISLASLASSGMYDQYAVASVYETAGNLPGYGQVVSPSLNATRYDMYYNLGTSWAFSSGQTATNYMFAGMGYWCYMLNAATLAGFEITPIAPDLD